MLGFLIGVSLAMFVLGCYLIIKNAKEKKAKKDNKDKIIKKGDNEP